jgi:hypothetical protein
MNHLTIDKPSSAPSGQPLYTLHNGWLIAAWSSIYIFSVWWVRTNVLVDDSFQPRAAVVSYVMVPVGLLIRTSAVAFCLFTGLLLTNRKLSFGSVFKIALFAESALVAFAVIKLLLLVFFHPVTRLQDLEAFAPLSLWNIPGASSLPRWVMYPLQTINLFEIAYWLLLAIGLRHYLGQPVGKMLALVLGSYGLGLLCWMAGIVFLVVNLSH